MDLRTALPALLPPAISRAEARSREIQMHRFVLPGEGLALARMVGVAHSELVRVASARALPLPEDEALRSADTSGAALLAVEAILWPVGCGGASHCVVFRFRKLNGA
jgi:hypothetical protein